MRSMKLLQGIRTLVLAGILTMAGTSGVLAEYTSWQDTDYDFSQVKTVVPVGYGHERVPAHK